MIKNQLLNQQLELAKTKSEADSIPKLRDSSAQYIANMINSKQYQSYLEIGTAYGFSCLYMATFCSSLKVIYSLEKDLEKHLVAKSFCDQFDWIKLINISCFDYRSEYKFDVILVDGPKSKQIDLVDQYLNYLNRDGLMIIDNIYLKKISSLTKLTKNQQKLLNANQALVDYLKTNIAINVEFVDLDDGLALITFK